MQQISCRIIIIQIKKADNSSAFFFITYSLWLVVNAPSKEQPPNHEDQALFKDNNVVKIRGDWTKPNKKIEKYLNSFHRFGIPFNVMYNQSYSLLIFLASKHIKKN